MTEHQQLILLFEHAIKLSESERAAFFEDMATTHGSLREQLVEMVADWQAMPPDFLDAPAISDANHIKLALVQLFNDNYKPSEALDCYAEPLEPTKTS